MYNDNNGRKSYSNNSKRENGFKPKEYKMSDYQLIGQPNVIGPRGDKGWNLELNIIKWNPDSEEKFDIRPWASDHKSMGKGVSMTKAEVSSLKNILNSMEDI